jgi:hypothetical protein
MRDTSNDVTVRLEGFTYGPLVGIAYMPYPNLPEYGYHIMSECGKVAMTVNTGKAKARIDNAVGLPVFYYD